MSYRYIINIGCEKFKEFTLNIKNIFSENQQTIHKARNELKIFNFEQEELVVKSFKKPNLLNRLIYSYFRSSKAKKSYDNSIIIGDFTPKPVSYIEYFSYGLIEQSYFISQRFDYDFTIREPLIKPDFENKEEIFKAFANFSFKLHDRGIFHKDFSPGNILVKVLENGYEFKIVDINRMKFMPLSLEKRLKNFSKLWAKNEDMKIIAQEYAKLMNEDEEKCIDLAIRFSQKHKDRINMKKRLRGIEVVD
ncbi:lipopolysaccharide kinase InaA family protein [Halarcobacter ebronensis]|uniref:Protein kinase domain-containing protein n=1 Tax=Halarcobacter ebronensis TaxID=1462615 RepID=A0A4Q1AQP5_9BACT|nr:lipopolysaccharide kinase InaA family protein [Halarcobacter ebronensis]QKF82557.1 hypothetical protein AEBR_2080 [Halarcobacter ebronensis]RXK07429.1 hypothetical protein CRV07_02905 [Halarcobacter ebronensis]